MFRADDLRSSFLPLAAAAGLALVLGACTVPPSFAGGALTAPDVTGVKRAGQIVENDVVFNLTGLRYTVAEEGEAGSVDVEAVAAHELGHSHGLAHSLINQVSPEDGTSVTMFPFFRTFDPVDQVAMRSPEQDDIGFSSLFYPEGSTASGPGALQPGDVAFDAAYGVIEGEVIHGAFGVGVPGASVSAVDTASGEIVAAAYSGTVVRSFEPGTFRARLLPGFGSVLDGRYRLPVPVGQYRVEIEPIDGFPVSTGSISPTARVGSQLGLLDFPEETFHEGEPEGAFELFPGRITPVNASAGSSRGGVDLVTNRSGTLAVAPVAPPLALATAPPGAYLAQEVPAAQLAAADTGERLVVQGARFFTLARFPSGVPVAAEAFFTTGRFLDENFAEIDLDDPLAYTTFFVGQELDLAPWFFQNSVAVGQRVREVLAAGDDRTFFLVLRTPDDGSVPEFNLLVVGTFNFTGRTGSYFSGNGQVWGSSPLPLPLLFNLQVAESVP